MDPNSAHQQWSEWTFVVEVAASSPAQLTLDEVATPLGRFFTATMGSAGRMKIHQAYNPARRRSVWTVTVQIEGEHVYEAGWRNHVLQAFTLAAQRRFGAGVRVQMDVRLLAGQTEDGTPNSQWLILPTIEDEAVALFGVHARPVQVLGMPAVPSAVRMW